MQKKNHGTIIYYALGVHLNTLEVIIKYFNWGGNGLIQMRSRKVTKFHVNFEMPISKAGDAL